ncbi:hypothetical protein CBR_g17136 [Chara braunii]|uniref:Uncharacterized protein n=1 Tax=Chara braunii TaxID=69332 RepID=A0A388KUS4_CHABU|nr:hypothetical protein CBR_g17136 [Chara braunii]|eukprot:GBG73797.1 hypothetical protein CBR_g17136 [Chara braunii]
MELPGWPDRGVGAAAGDGGPDAGRLAIGIDLGTSFSCVGIWTRGDVYIPRNEVGSAMTPSVVAFTAEEQLVGARAVAFGKVHPEDMVFESKRLIGRTADDASLQLDMKRWPFKVVKGQANRAVVWLPRLSAEVSPEEVSARLLAHMRGIAEDFVGKGSAEGGGGGGGAQSNVVDAVITVPAYFNDAQRQATKDAGAIAGLNVLELMNEPTAAALAFAYQRLLAHGKRTVMVFDLGGGTLDVAIMTIDGDDFEVRALAGDTHLGGADFDANLIQHVLATVKERYPNVEVSPKALRQIREVCVQAKIHLSSANDVVFDIPILPSMAEELEVRVTRVEFDKMNQDLFNRCIECVHVALLDAGITKEEISDVLMVGGSSRIPKIANMLASFMGKRPLTCVNPDEAVAYGAAVQAAIKASRGRSAAAAAASAAGGGGNFNAPPTQEAAAAVEIGTGYDQPRSVRLHEVVPRSIGVELDGDAMHVVIRKNSRRPATGTCVLTTSKDYQTTMQFPVYEGESTCSKKNHYLGKFCLSGFEPAPAGEASAEVTFNVDENGILSATARALTRNAEGRTAVATITTDKGRLTSQDIRMMANQLKAFSNLGEAGDRLRTQGGYARDHHPVVNHVNPDPDPWFGHRNKENNLFFRGQQTDHHGGCVDGRRAYQSDVGAYLIERGKPQEVGPAYRYHGGMCGQQVGPQSGFNPQLQRSIPVVNDNDSQRPPSREPTVSCKCCGCAFSWFWRT